MLLFSDYAIIISILYVFTGNIKLYNIYNKCHVVLPSYKFKLSNYGDYFTVIAFDKANLIC